MSGKVWILITAVSFITHVYHVQSKCMKQDIKAHLDELMLEEHVFQMKVFSPETKERELLSVINTLCSYWTNNKGKDKLKVVQTFHIMLYNLDEKFKDFCANLNCTDAYTVRGIDTATFGEMYKESCNGSVSDLKCPSKSAPLTTISPTPEFSLTSLTTLVSPNITAPENLTADPSAHTETIIKDDSQWATIKTCSGLLVVSFLLNTVLLFKVFHMHRKSKTSREMTHLELQGRHLISK
ncbi:uncharacterized protein [Sinocyclocheilus grahami]|uniref:uncharacterized protein isoform X3 n=1 Tax=Sinocyclocheilus grahami TaxID=75366 RepID=UPI0007AD4B59|nr:PREDICTED: uncharacterized protein LOC107583020 isoform X3 [Sinocyclocheilus grahami]